MKPMIFEKATPESQGIDSELLLKALGAELVLTPGKEGMAGAISKAEELLKSIPGAAEKRQKRRFPPQTPTAECS